MELVTHIIIAATTLLASCCGYLFAGLNERRRDERIRERETALRRFERDAELENAKHALQRKTLLALQDALQQSARLTGRSLHFDHMQAREGKYTQLPDGLSEETYAVNVEVSRLTARVLDPDVRGAVKDFSERSTRLSMLPIDLQGHRGPELESYALAKLQEFGTAYDLVTDVVGEAVRREIDWRPSGDESENTAAS